MNIIICKDYQELSKTAASQVIDIINHNPHSILGLSTGSSPLGLYQELIKAYQESKVSFKHVTTFNLDEYVDIDYNHKESYHYYMHMNFFKDIDIPLENTHIPKTNSPLKKAVTDYDFMLKAHPIDLQILGLGTNGHIGFNEPGTPFSKKTFVVALKEETRRDNARFFKSLDEVPTQALTMGIKSIMRAKKIILLVFGAHKKDALYSMMYGNITPEIPASILQLHNNLTIITDESAATRIKQRTTEK